MIASDISALRERARAGDPGALTALDKRLLIGDGVRQAPQEAINCLSEAARRGGGEATAQLALFAGWGVLRPRNLDDALDHLQRVNLADWTRVTPQRVVSKVPKISIIDGFASSAECDWLIECGRHRLKRAMAYRKDAAGHSTVQTRTNTEADFTVVNTDLVLSLIRDRIAAAIGVATEFFEITKLLHYEPGQHFSLHADFLELNTPALVQEVEQHGQRVMTFLAYLNDDFEGGETDFPRIGLRHKGRRGDALLFSNVDESGAPDYQTVHAGLPPASGVKWLLSQWVRDRAVSS